MNFDLATYFSTKKSLVESALRSRWMPAASFDPIRLQESASYSLFADGKRVRPVLTFATAHVLGLSDDDVLPIAAALEMIHVFSLIHDDLPAMDDDDLRRGQPTNHKVYGEALAILAGDALLAQAFIPLTEINTQKFGAESVLRVIRLIADATGFNGMIGGQVIDMESEGRAISLARLQTLHRKKTGALIEAAILAPVELRAATAEQREALSEYGAAIGLLFQITDDILDIEGGVELGKDIGSDVARGKSTYPALMGLDGAKAERERVLANAMNAVRIFGDAATPLTAIADFIAKRKK